MGHPNHLQNTADGLSQRVSSPRFSGPMTRRAFSFKRNNNNNSTQHEIDLQLNSPRSEISANQVSADGFESVIEKKQTHHHITHRNHGKKSIGSVSVDLVFGGKKKLGHWMFLFFCGVFLFWGVFKFCANGWFGSVIDGIGSDQVCFNFSKLMSVLEQECHL